MIYIYPSYCYLLFIYFNVYVIMIYRKYCVLAVLQLHDGTENVLFLPQPVSKWLQLYQQQLLLLLLLLLSPLHWRFWLRRL